MRKLLLLLLVVLIVLIAVVSVRTTTFKSRQLTPPQADLPSVDATAAERLAQAVRIRTVSHNDPARFDGAGFLELHTFLEATYPRAHAALKREVVNEYSLLYTWPGRDPDAQSILILAHLDVVPADAGDDWTHRPFDGVIADGFVWGRGTLDDKVSVLGLFEAVEILLREDFQPRRTIYFAFGHDEEIDGDNGAAKIAALLEKRDVHPECVLDEGLVITKGMLPGVDAPIALIGIAEKGYVTLTLEATGEGGHASMPPPHTAVGHIATAVHALEANPMPASLEGPVREMFAYLGPEMPVTLRMAVANQWLFGGLLEGKLAGGAATNAVMRTTGAATMIDGGTKENVLPQRARAVVNFRILPGDSSETVIDHVRSVIDTDHVQIAGVDLWSEPSHVANTDSRAFSMLQTSVGQVFPEAIVAPGLAIVATDSRHYAHLGGDIFRFIPLVLTREDTARIHGKDERIAVASYTKVIQFYAVLMRNAAS